MDKKIRNLQQKIVPILKRNGVAKAGIFGSYARGEAKKKSDVDILIKYKTKKSLLDFVHLKLELEQELHKKVDLVTYKSIYPALKEEILGDEVRIL